MYENLPEALIEQSAEFEIAVNKILGGIAWISIDEDFGNTEKTIFYQLKFKPNKYIKRFGGVPVTKYFKNLIEVMALEVFGVTGESITYNHNQNIFWINIK